MLILVYFFLIPGVTVATRSGTYPAQMVTAVTRTRLYPDQMMDQHLGTIGNTISGLLVPREREGLGRGSSSTPTSSAQAQNDSRPS